MPLADHFPRIDDRTESDILGEALARIPRYTPEWTDYNAGDPGVALLELFAWMSEMLIFRLGRVPELNYLKFLELVGIELRPARPATTIIVFPVLAGFAGQFVTVPSRTQVSAAEADEAGPILFETERSLTALRTRLEAVQSHDGYAYSDVSAANSELEGFLPFGQSANAGTSLLLGFSGDAELPASVELSLAFWPAADRKVPPPAPCGGGTVAATPPGRLTWEFWAGTEWRPLTVLADETLAFTRSGLVRLRTPPPAQAVKATIGKSAGAARWWIRARLEQASYETAPRLLGVRSNAVRADQAESVAMEVLGGSQGTPNQIFRLGSIPVLDGSLDLSVDETGQAAPWQEVSDFLGSGPRDPHFVLNRSTGEVRFGDGRQGRIPAANPDSPSNIVATLYRTGGGVRGNLGAGQLTTPMAALSGIDTGQVTNPVAAEGGTDEESLDSAIERAPVALKARDRAVTAEDYEMLAAQAGPVRRAKAIPLYHPHFPGLDVPGTVSVLIVPDAPGEAPTPSEALLQTVCRHLDGRRLLTTELFVIPPVYVGADLRIDVVAEADADAGAVSLAVEDAVRAYLHPLTGGRDGLGWPFGEPIRYGELYRRVLIDGVERVPELVIALESIEKPQCQDVPIPTGALIRVDSVTVAVRDAEDELAS